MATAAISMMQAVSKSTPTATEARHGQLGKPHSSTFRRRRDDDRSGSDGPDPRRAEGSVPTYPAGSILPLDAKPRGLKLYTQIERQGGQHEGGTAPQGSEL